MPGFYSYYENEKNWNRNIKKKKFKLISTKIQLFEPFFKIIKIDIL